MMNSPNPEKELYSESEAAQALGITLERLYKLLDEHVFNDGSPRPEGMNFRGSDLVLLSFWNRSTPNPKVVRMPRRM